jgi:dephospho-CoA kinase
MLKVGLTGGIGSGKTTVANMFAKLGVDVIDTDVISHQLTSDKSVLDEIQKLFGDNVIQQDGTLNRTLLADKAFANDQAKTKLENILHPRIRDRVIQELSKLDNPPYAIIVVPLLLETDFHTLIDRILVVDLGEGEQVERVQRRDNRDETEIRRIISHQMSRKKRLAKADDIISNTGKLDQLKLAVQKLHRQYLDQHI